MNITSKKKLQGIIPPMITPLTDNDTLDMVGLERLVNRFIDAKVHGLFILGTSGEAQSLSYSLRAELIEQTATLIAGQIPLLVGITDTSIDESQKLAKIAADNNAVALVAAAPYYYLPSQSELIKYYNHLAEKISLPLFLYNMPSHTKVQMDLQTVKELSKNPNIIGIKDSSGNAVYYQSLLHAFRDHPAFSVFVGPEEMLAETVLTGGHGAVCGGANLFPKLFVELYEASVNKDFAKIKDLQSKVMSISTSLYSVGKHSASFIKAIKCALALLGVCSDFMAEPLYCFGDDEKREIKKILIDLDK